MIAFGPATLRGYLISTIRFTLCQRELSSFFRFCPRNGDDLHSHLSHRSVIDGWGRVIDDAAIARAANGMAL
jgi:hypothetical protein